MIRVKKASMAAEWWRSESEFEEKSEEGAVTIAAD
jgi:hypothetical protein